MSVDPSQAALSNLVLMLLVGVGGGIIFIYLLPRLAKQLWIVRNLLFDADTETDIVTAVAITPPVPYAETNAALCNLGLELLGVLRIQTPVLPSPFLEWCYTTADHATAAEVIYNLLSPVYVEFKTCFEDDAMIVTAYPLGETVTTPNYVSRFARHSIEAAFRFHQQQVMKWKTIHGEPMPIRTADDIVKIEHTWKLRHRRAAIARLRHAEIMNAGWQLILQFSILVFIFAVFALNPPLILIVGALGLLALNRSVRIEHTLRDYATNPPFAVDLNAVTSNRQGK